MKSAILLMVIMLSACHGVSEEDKTRFRLGELDHSLQMYKGDTGKYPSEQCGLKCLQQNKDEAQGWKGPYYELTSETGKEYDGSQEPFSYRLHASGYLLYSIGRNRVDDGGAEDDLLSQQSAKP